ncbi:MAG: DNA-3-methyladenine glycosylase 2 family protein [Rhodospirillaceae bacterium]|nr:DNA-3-methyladenine glycosylase 2 family protein [Rhodospirillaceae bacterium]
MSAARPNAPLEGRRLTRGLTALAGCDPDMARAIEAAGRLPARSRDPGFPTLLNIIMAQQLSTASAGAIWGRLEAAADPMTPSALLKIHPRRLRTIGLSRQKALYARELAKALEARHLDLDALPAMDDEAVIAALTAVKGIGRWTAEIYLLFSLGRPDVMPADDLALQVAAQRIKGLDARPKARELRAMAEAWHPWRSVAARVLWHYYKIVPI